jgi:hypothetical protein
MRSNLKSILFMGTQKKISLSLEFELNTQTQNSLRMSYSTQNSAS